MGLKAGLHLLQQAGKVVANYADDAARLAAQSGDDIARTVATRADDAVGIFCRKPVTVNPAELKGLRFEPEAIGDTVKITKTAFKIPSAEKLKLLLKEQGMVDDFITDNNSIFLEELLKRFPLKQGEKTNKVVQDLMTCLEDINHASFTDKAKFLDDFLAEASKIDDTMGIIFAENRAKLFSKRAVLQAKYNNPERYQEIMDLLTLHKQGKAPKWTLQTLFPESSFHPLPKGDMQRLLRGEHYYPQLTELADDVIAKLEVGEAFSVGKEMFVKTAKGYEKLKIDAQTYERLFPPIERYAMSQGANGNCHFISAMDSITKNPNGRINLYQMFEQTPNGIVCRFPNSEARELLTSDIEAILSSTKSVKGSLAHKIVEFVYAETKKTTSGVYNSVDDVLAVLDRGGNPGDIKDYYKKILGLNVDCKTYIRNRYTTGYMDVAGSDIMIPDDIVRIKLQEGIACTDNGSIVNKRRGLFSSHYYAVDGTHINRIINPWNTLETIHQDPCELANITSVSR